MSTDDVLHPHNPEFERFLYASAGEDRRGQVVTVLSVLARLNLDPWEEAAALATLDRAAADSRLGLLLSRCPDVLALGRGHGSAARDLTHLLPQRTARTLRPDGSSAEQRQMVSSQTIWVFAAILLVVMQMMSVFALGSVE